VARYWEDEEPYEHDEDIEATKDPGDYHGGPCGVMVLLVPFVAIWVLGKALINKIGN
jgi:hypothetical protein